MGTGADSEQELYRRAFALAVFTIVYNVVEGLVSMLLGWSDETLALFGFGVDSFIEVMSGVGIAVMIARIRRSPDGARSGFETTALRITGASFHLLTAGLAAGIAWNIVERRVPETTMWGVVVSAVSIAVMLWLVRAKRRVGTRLGSEPIMADAACTMICVYMSLVLLASSLVYELTGFAYADAIGTAGLAWLSFLEGREAFEKARGKECRCKGTCG
jgi:divalent metal cation (Fe/Co/Zn/Cd) transporter